MSTSAVTTAPAERANRFLDAMEHEDVMTIAGMLDEEIIWSTPMFPGDGPVRGIDALGAKMMEIGGLMQKVKFADRRVTVSADGSTTFVQTTGDFVSNEGKAYQNVYVFRFDWRDGKIVTWEEYADYLTILRTFPEKYAYEIALAFPSQ